MFICKVENSLGEQIVLTQNESQFQVFQIDGLNPTNAQINTTPLASIDGAKFNSSKLETKQLVIYIKLNGEVEENRLKLYSFFPTKEWCRFFYKNGLRDVFIDGYVQTVEVTPFTNEEIMQVAILCPQSYFKGVDEIITDISKTVSLFKFPFSIDEAVPVPISEYRDNRVTVITNRSESRSGLYIDVSVLGSIKKILIRNTVTGEQIVIINPDGFIYGDTIKIDTYQGEKSVILVRNGIKTNLFSKLQSGFTFLQLERGDNRFSYQIDNGANDHLVNIQFRYHPLYRGV